MTRFPRLLSLALPLTLLLGASLRLYHLASNPPELFSDELNLYVSAHSIFTRGYDVDGTLQPFFYCPITRNPPVYAIVGYLSTLVFGNGAFGQRFPAAAFGVVDIALLYAITLELTGRRKIALIAAFLQAIQPVLIHFSRVAWEPASELPFLLGGSYAFLRAFSSKEEKPSFERLALGALLFGIAAYTYPAAWAYAVILGGTLLVFHAPRCFRVREDGMKMLATIALWAGISLPALLMMFTDPHTYMKIRWIATFKDGVTAAGLHTFFINYRLHFGWPFLFASGSPEPKYLSGVGELYWWIAPLSVIGFIYGKTYLRTWRAAAWVGVWLAAYPLGGSFTNDDIIPNAPRVLAGMPVFCILAALGLEALYDFSRFFTSQRFASAYRFVLSGAGLACASASLFSFCVFYFGTYPRISAASWESGTGAAFAAVREHALGYDRVCFQGISGWRIPTYIHYYIDDLALQKFDDANNPHCSMPGTLLVSTVPVTSPGFRLLSVANRVDGTPYAVIEAKPLR